jgi:hypothetical protein
VVSFFASDAADTSCSFFIATLVSRLFHFKLTGEAGIGGTTTLEVWSDSVLKLVWKAKATTPLAIGIQFRLTFLELIMDEEEARRHHLRRLAQGWLETLRDSATGPYAGRAFPEQFPFGGVPLRSTFAWNEFDGYERWLDFPVSLEFITTSPDTSAILPSAPLARYTWRVTSRTHLVSCNGFGELTAMVTSDSNGP